MTTPTTPAAAAAHGAARNAREALEAIHDALNGPTGTPTPEDMAQMEGATADLLASLQDLRRARAVHTLRQTVRFHARPVRLVTDAEMADLLAAAARAMLDATGEDADE